MKSTILFLLAAFCLYGCTLAHPTKPYNAVEDLKSFLDEEISVPSPKHTQSLELTGEMTLDRCIETALQNNPELAASDWEVAASVARLKQAQASRWPTVVSKVSVADGDYVAPRAILIEVYDPHSLAVQLAVPEVQSMAVRQKMPVRVELDAYPKKFFKGEISRVYPQLDTEMRTRTVEVSVLEPIDLIPGMFARTQVVLEEVREAVVAPIEAVKISPKGGRVVFVVEDGKAALRKIETGIEAGGKIQIITGISPGEQVIVAGQEKLKDGAAVQVETGGGH